MKSKFDPKKTIYLIDGSTFLYRAYYSMKPLHTSSGIPIQAVYVFCRMIKKLINIFDPHKIALVWDSKGKVEREEIYPDYKHGRQEPPIDIFQQRQLIIKFAQDIGLYQIEKPKIEADDIIGSITKDFKKKFNIVIIASDKDLYQLLDQNIFVYDSFKEELIDQKSFEQKYGFSSDKLPFYFALVGDVSDNIPGVKGIGKVIAAKIVKEFKNLNDLYKNINKIKKDRIKNLLLQNKNNAFLSYKLFKLIYHKLNISAENLDFDPNNWVKAKQLFSELEFKSLLQDIEKVPKSPKRI